MDGGSTDGRAARWARGLVVAALLASAVAPAVGCGSSSSEADRARAAKAAAGRKLHARLMAQGTQVFRANCLSCHTLLGRTHLGTTGELGPSFNEVRLSLALVKRRVHEGGSGMQSFSDFSRRQVDAVATYVATLAGRSVAPRAREPGSPDLAAGAAVFASTCHACHTMNGERATNRYVDIGTNFENVRPSERYVVQMVRHGNIWMPAFEKRLTDAQIGAVAKYVSSVAGVYHGNPEPR